MCLLQNEKKSHLKDLQSPKENKVILKRKAKCSVLECECECNVYVHSLLKWKYKSKTMFRDLTIEMLVFNIPLSFISCHSLEGSKKKEKEKQIK